VVESIESFVRHRNELVNLFWDVAVHRPGVESISALHKFFEKLMRYNHRPEGVSSWNELDFDNFRFLTHELFLYSVAVLLKNERFADAGLLLTSEYYCPHFTDYGKMEMVSFTAFFDPPQCLEERNRRLQLRKLSLQAELLKQRCVDLPVSFIDLMQADFVLFLRSQCSAAAFGTWWPITLVYNGHFPARFEVFARARSRRYFETLRPVLGVDNVEQFKSIVGEFSEGKRQAPRWQFNGVDVAVLSGIKELAIRE